MLNDNIKNLRKQRGFSQEELATRLHVVRQTISKWEKGISVPDADMLKRMAEVLEVSVPNLLGADVDMEEKSNHNEIAEQLSRINEQLIIRNRRTRKIWMIIGGIIFVPLLVYILLAAIYIVPTRQNVTYTDYLHGTVTEVTDSYILVAPLADTDGAADKDKVDLVRIPWEDIADYFDGEDNDEYLVVGDVVTISYNGDVEDGHPATLPVCYGITDIEHAK